MDMETCLPQAGKSKKTYSTNLLLRTLYHGVNLVLCYFVSLWGIITCLTLEVTEDTNPLIKDLKYLAPAFGTNWNYNVLLQSVVGGSVVYYSAGCTTCRTIFHGINFALFNAVGVWGFVLCYSIDDTKFDDPIIRDLKYLAFCFLTNWNFAFQTLFLTLSLVNDVLEWMNKHEHHLAAKLRYWRDIIFTSLVVPFTLFVSSMFWCVYAVDRELVFPKAYDEVVPWWFNHCVHTNISVVVLIETLLQARRHPRNQKLELINIIVVDIAYAVVYYAIYYFTNRWLYKVFGVMTWWQVCLYQLLIWLSSFIFYTIQFPINRLVHGDAEETEKEVIVDSHVINNGVKHEEQTTVGADMKETDVLTNSWSLKYRSSRNESENSQL